MDIRLICTSCGTKWFARPGEHAPERLVRCGACEGPLVLLAPDPARDACGAARRWRPASG